MKAVNESLSMFGKFSRAYRTKGGKPLSPITVVTQTSCECHEVPAKKTWREGRIWYGECAVTNDILRVFDAGE